MFSSHEMLEIHKEIDVEQFFLLDTSDINSGARDAGFNLSARTEFCMSGRLKSAPGCCSLYHPPLAIAADVAF